MQSVDLRSAQTRLCSEGLLKGSDLSLGSVLIEEGGKTSRELFAEFWGDLGSSGGFLFGHDVFVLKRLVSFLCCQDCLLAITRILGSGREGVEFNNLQTLGSLCHIYYIEGIRGCHQFGSK